MPSREQFRLQRVSVMQQVSDDLLDMVTGFVEGTVSPTQLYQLIEDLFSTEYTQQSNNTFAINDNLREAWSWFKDKIQVGIDKVTRDSKPRLIADWLGTAIVNGALVAANHNKEQKLWLSRRDPKVRPTHVDADGQTVGWDQPFTVAGGVEVMFPGEPVGPPELWINCRCVAVNADAITAGGAPVMSATKGKSSFTPPAGVRSAAKRALQLIKDGRAGSGFTDVGRARAAQLAGGGSVSRATIKRMNAYFSRHKGDKKPGWSKKGQETPGYVAWLAWGGDPGAAWARKMVRSFEAEASSEEVVVIDATLTDEDVAAFAATVEEDDDMPPPAEDDMPDEELPTDEEILDDEDPEEDDTDFTIIPDRIPWKGILAPEGIRSGDGRKFSLGALTHRDLPLPLRVQEADIGGHDGAITVGTIDNIWRDDNNMVWGSGDFIDLDLADKVVGQIMDGALRGVSIDADDAEMAAESDENEVEFSKARICAATLVAIPAFSQAYVQLGAPDEGAVAASGEFKRGAGWVTHPQETRRLHAYWTKGKGAAKIRWGTPGDYRRLRRALAKYINPAYLNRTVAQWHKDALGYWPGECGKPGNPKCGEKRKGVMASAVNLVAAAPDMLPAKFFKNPMLEGPTAITVDEDDHIYGHLALWGTCHIGIQNACTTAPHSQQDYAYFRTGAVLTDEGYISVGQITMGTGHADLHANPSQTAAHYDNTGFVVADVVVGEDKFGIWFSGMTRRGISKNDVHTLVAGALSGDWRRIGGNLELVAALVVNVPGFPVPRASLAASLHGQDSLVAAGVVDVPATDGDEYTHKLDVLYAEVARSRTARSNMISGLSREVRAAQIGLLRGEVV